MARIAFYSHDTMGLGHVRRNLALAEALAARHPDWSVLLVSGTHLGGAFRMPPGVDCITLPALGKQGPGAYSARHLGCSLEQIVGLRSQTIRAALERFDPDVLVVDNVPLGAQGELEPTLAALRMGRRTRIVLGLRDILDEPAAVAREWASAGHLASIDRYFDQIWIYGDRAVYDLPAEYGFPAHLEARVRYLGYLERRARHEARDLPIAAGTHRPYTLCLAGGGQDGAELALAFAAAAFPEGEDGVLLTGPFAPEPVKARTRELAAHRPDLHLIDFTEDGATLIAHAARVVGMAGYNSVCEILSYRKPALLVPREAPRLEQTIRAQRLEALGLVEVLPQGALTAEALSAWIRNPLPPAAASVAFTAQQRIGECIAGLLTPEPAVSGPLVRARAVATQAGAHVH